MTDDQLIFAMNGPQPAPSRTVATHGHALEWSTLPDIPPADDEHNGQRVTFEPWQITPKLTHAIHCEYCGWDGQRWLSIGTIHPEPGETTTTTITRQTRTSKKYNATIEVPAWPIRRFFLFCCPNCHDQYTIDIT